jgi:Tfp pilus assembly major pilin PilA
MRKQSGLTMISWIVIIGLVAVQGILALRIVPVYLNYNSVRTVMDELPQDAEVKGISVKNLNKLFRKRLKINNLYELARDKEAFKFKKAQGGYTLVAHYEEKGPIMGNLEFVATFDHEVVIITK